MVVVVICHDFPSLGRSIDNSPLGQPGVRFPDCLDLLETVRLQDTRTIKRWLVSARNYTSRVGLDGTEMAWKLNRIALLPYDVLLREGLVEPLMDLFRLSIADDRDVDDPGKRTDDPDECTNDHLDGVPRHSPSGCHRHLAEVWELLCRFCYHGIDLWIRTYNIPEKAFIEMMPDGMQDDEGFLDLILDNYIPDATTIVKMFRGWGPYISGRPQDYQRHHDFEYFAIDLLKIGCFFRYGLTTSAFGDCDPAWLPILDEWYTKVSVLERCPKQRQLQRLLDRERRTVSGASGKQPRSYIGTVLDDLWDKITLDPSSSD